MCIHICEVEYTTRVIILKYITLYTVHVPGREWPSLHTAVRETSSGCLRRGEGRGRGGGGGGKGEGEGVSSCQRLPRRRYSVYCRY